MQKALADKILVLGIDGMDPSLTKKYIGEGKMPNTKALLERGVAREDLVLLGGMPTITPPMWTTLCTGAYPYTHGITDFARQSPVGLDQTEYVLDSRLCQAEQLWNVFAESGKKTLVWHWPGSSWPPSSDSPNLSVVDGTQPGGVNTGTATIEHDFMLVGDVKVETSTFREKAASDANVPCMLTDLDIEEYQGATGSVVHDSVQGDNKQKPMKLIILTPEDGGSAFSDMPFDVVLSPIKVAHGWIAAPENAKEVTFLFSGGLVRRPALVLADAAGHYHQVAIYKSKKDQEPLAVLEKGVFHQDIIDEAIKGDLHYQVNRNMRIIEMAENGENLKIWVSSAMDIASDVVWHPKALHQLIVDNVGYPPPIAEFGSSDKRMITDCMKCNWDVSVKWQADALNYLIDKEKYEIIFSHFHNVDAQEHMFIKFLKNKGDAKLPESDYRQFLEDVYTQTDEYIGHFLHLLDEGWTILLVSDHALVSSDYESYDLGNCSGVNYRIMEQFGYTKVKRDENGKECYEIDWENTTAIANRGNHIYINLKGRDAHGIVDVADQYALEEKIMTDLYSYRHPKSGNRMVALALRNREAVLLGMGGPECGDIIYFMAEGYVSDHGSGLSTVHGYGGTTLGPIFIAAGKGLKNGTTTSRVIRQVDVAPTMAVLGGVRMPRECEGAPVYQILADY